VSNFTHSAQTVLNRALRSSKNALAASGSASTTSADGSDATFSEQEVWNKVFNASTNRIRLTA
jgi:hypothetical protein